MKKNNIFRVLAMMMAILVMLFAFAACPQTGNGNGDDNGDDATPTPIPELVTNGDFETGDVTGWTFNDWSSGAAAATVSVVADASGDNKLKVEITDAGAEDWHLSVASGTITGLTVGTTYIMQYELSAVLDTTSDATNDLQVLLTTEDSVNSVYVSHADNDTWAYDRIVGGEETQVFGRIFTYADPASDSATPFVKIGLGLSATGTIYVDNISIKEIDTTALTNLVSNGDFATDTTGWTLNDWSSGAAAASISVVADASDDDDNKLEIDITDAGDEDWHLSLQTGNLTMTEGKTYILMYEIGNAVSGATGADNSAYCIVTTEDSTNSVYVSHTDGDNWVYDQITDTKVIGRVFVYENPASDTATPFFKIALGLADVGKIYLDDVQLYQLD